MRGILLTAVATIGVGIALNTTISALMFPASRSPWQRNLVRAVGATQADANSFALQSEFFSDAFAETRWTTRIGDKPVRGMIVTANYFSVFGIAPPMNAAAGVPEITPVDPVNVSGVGKLPEVTNQAIAPWPPLAFRV